MSKEWDNLKSIVQETLSRAKALGVDAAEAALSYGKGLSATVRLGETETIEFNQDKVLTLTVYKGKRKGSTSTTDIRREAIEGALKAACNIADYTEADPYAGLAAAEQMARSVVDVDIYFPDTISPEEAKNLAKTCENSARTFDKRIVNSEGATFSTHTHYQVYGNSHGFLGAYPSSRHSLSCSVIAEAGQSMQRDYDYTLARDRRDLDSGVSVGQRAALKTLRRLNARKMKTCEAPVIFSAEVAGSLWSHFIMAISGGNLYRKSSFLLDHLGKKVFPEFVSIKEAPHLKKGMGSAPFDQEGVATREQTIVKEGQLQSYILSSYSARRLGMKTTGNAGGVHNLMVSASELDLPQLLESMQTGLLVTELMGQGVNLVTGDYSRGAAGFWVENGEIQYPVEEITIAGNLKDMFLGMVAIGEDIETRRNILSGSVWINQMTIAGS